MNRLKVPDHHSFLRFQYKIHYLCAKNISNTIKNLVTVQVKCINDMKRLIHFFVWILGISVVAISCKDKEEKARKFARMNIAEAKLLYIASSSSSSKLYGIKKSSLKSTSDANDEIYEIEYLDENGKLIEGIIPDYIFDAGDFLIVIFEKFNEQTTGWVNKSDAYFVKKSDGSAYKIPDEYFPSVSGNQELFYNHNTNIRRFRYSNIINNWDFLNFCYDKNNNIYFTVVDCSKNPGHACPHIVYKVYPSSTMNFQQVSKDDGAWGYCLDDNGNLIYGSGYEQMRFGSTNGSFSEPIPTIVRANNNVPLEIYRFVWAGADGIMSLKTVIYDICPETGEVIIDNRPPRQYLMKMENGQFVKKSEIALDFSMDNNYPSSYNVFYVRGKVIYSHFYGSTATLVDVSNVNSYREIPCSVEANIVINNELYHFDKNTFSLTHINIDNGATTPVFSLDKSVLSDYSISCIMDVTESSIMFGAYRRSDNMKVVAKIGLGNVLTIMQSNSGDVSVIMPLNP